MYCDSVSWYGTCRCNWHRSTAPISRQNRQGGADDQVKTIGYGLTLTRFTVTLTRLRGEQKHKSFNPALAKIMGCRQLITAHRLRHGSLWTD